MIGRNSYLDIFQEEVVTDPTSRLTINRPFALTHLIILQVVQFDHYGKETIKAHKCSPDAWVQMVKQLAYGKIFHGQPAVTYESAQTRKFKLGRTEVIRSASQQSKEFVEAMLKKGVSVSVSRSGISEWDRESIRVVLL